MREIKFLGNLKLKKDNRNYKYSIFLCDHCGSEVIKKTKYGIKSKVCSHECYSETRTERGSYKESVIISGYRYILKTNHPKSTKKGYIAEHRLVIEKKLNRYLNKNEDVHHLNFNKLDNSIDNLIVLTKSQHSKLHYYINKKIGVGLSGK